MTDHIDFTEPKGIALILCDNIYQEPGTKKYALIGLFSAISVLRTPVVHPQMCVYASFTESMPNTNVRLDIVDASTLEPIFEAGSGSELPQNDPKMVYEFIYNLKNIEFPKAGLYYVRILGNDISVIERPIRVRIVGHSN